jgi:hypothetical protein
MTIEDLRKRLSLCSCREDMHDMIGFEEDALVVFLQRINAEHERI